MWSHFLKWFREHALWDAAKEVTGWLWAAGGSAVTLAVQTVAGFFRQHQDLTALLLNAGVFLVLVGVAKYISHGSNERVLNKVPLGDADDGVKLTRVKEYQQPPFHPSLAECGRRIESAVYGSANKTPDNVIKRVLAYATSGRREIPVNHHELCEGSPPHDPDPGEDQKFLTITMSETLRQSSKLILPLEWLNESQLQKAAAEAPRLRIEYAAKGPKNFLTLINTGPGLLRSWNFRPLKCSYARSLATPYGNPEITSENRIVQEFQFDGDGLPLSTFIRERLPVNATITAEVYYEDNKGRGFIREFLLRSAMDDSLIWEAGPIKPQGLSRA